LTAAIPYHEIGVGQIEFRVRGADLGSRDSHAVLRDRKTLTPETGRNLESSIDG
jgi:hypothetical protein